MITKYSLVQVQSRKFLEEFLFLFLIYVLLPGAFYLGRLIHDSGPAQLTIFYGGKVNVLNEITPEKVPAIMNLAGNHCLAQIISQKRLQVLSPTDKLSYYRKNRATSHPRQELMNLTSQFNPASPTESVLHVWQICVSSWHHIMGQCLL